MESRPPVMPGGGALHPSGLPGERIGRETSLDVIRTHHDDVAQNIDQGIRHRRSHQHSLQAQPSTRVRRVSDQPIQQRKGNVRLLPGVVGQDKIDMKRSKMTEDTQQTLDIPMRHFPQECTSVPIDAGGDLRSRHPGECFSVQCPLLIPGRYRSGYTDPG